jgi:hypothetical protein
MCNKRLGLAISKKKKKKTSIRPKSKHFLQKYRTTGQGRIQTLGLGIVRK